ncbi:glycosyltransferase family 39 protein [Biostraticola tofi]|uniref:Dolichyl-phosphate-mannose-protein mannosyltransferase n=1 Tax=Biostraticola tofi TaxID=466109 RepID=A0A4R3YVS6_9GAMM|nr:glycosyltransferase family 39 protein [Biostraticola tofi]TCV96690.1 dolichyl-phosphate-mannose-protein mannosyltransferase [Biostraticola tofi]
MKIIPQSLIGWVAAFAILWTLATTILDPTVPYDAVEALNWATNAEWGSPKNPWLVGWIMRPALLLPGKYLSLYWYGSHFLAVAIGMVGVWLLARRLTGSASMAWLALFCLNLSGIVHIDIIPYNDNYLLVMLWPWLWLFFLRATSQSPTWWLALALTAGLSAMAKYSSMAFIGMMLVLTIVMPTLRKCWRQPLFYLSMLLWLAIVLPNLWWLWHHDFVAFSWVGSQIESGITLHGLTAALTVFYPLLILAALLKSAGGQFGWPQAREARVAVLAFIVPVVVILIVFTLHDGGRITEWLQPFMMPASALLMACLTRLPHRPLRRPIIILGAIAVLVWAGYIAVMMANVRNAGEKFAGIKPFSQQVQQLWHQRFERPLRYVGGEYLSQWLTFYADDRPQVMTPWTDDRKPNIYNRHISQRLISDHGGVLVGTLGKTCADAFGSERRLRDYLPDSGTDLPLSHLERHQWVFTSTEGAPGEPVCILLIPPATAMLERSNDGHTPLPAK